MQLRMVCKDFLSKLVKQLMEKSPLKFLVVRNMSSLDPRQMGTAAKESNVQKFKAVLKTI